MKITDRLRRDADYIWRRIFEHPFVVELYSGILPMDKFIPYILEDYNYLIGAIRNFSIMVSRAESVDVMKELVEIVRLEAESEVKGYGEFLVSLGYSLEDAAQIEPGPMNVAYENFLLITSSFKTVAEALAAVLPCFWSYHEIAVFYQERLPSNPNQVYVDWASVYVSDEYVTLLNKLKGLVDSLGQNFDYQKLKEVFIQGSRYEYMYWDAVYNRDGWPV
ncbi:MAG: TenA family protein [Deltaproteobacteria bacterium]|nr:TenA family protein [Deltaproteobacteria bacterium]